MDHESSQRPKAVTTTKKPVPVASHTTIPDKTRPAAIKTPSKIQPTSNRLIARPTQSAKNASPSRSSTVRSVSPNIHPTNQHLTSRPSRTTKDASPSRATATRSISPNVQPVAASQSLTVKPSRTIKDASPSRPSAATRRSTTPTRKKNQIAPTTKIATESKTNSKIPKDVHKLTSSDNKDELVNSNDTKSVKEHRNSIITSANVEVIPILKQRDTATVDNSKEVAIHKSVSDKNKSNSDHGNLTVSNQDTKKKDDLPKLEDQLNLEESNISENMLIDISTQIMRLQEETMRSINRYYMPGLQRKIDLTKEKPTLATMTRFHRLSRLMGILQELNSVLQELTRWLGDIQLPKELIDLAMNSLIRIEKSSQEMKKVWITVTAALDASTDLSGRSLEHKANLFHGSLEDSLSALVDFILPLHRNKTILKSGHLPIPSDRLVDIELSFPAKFASLEGDN